MNTREAAAKIEAILDRNVPSDREALVRAKQALEILATIEEKLRTRTLQVDNWLHRKSMRWEVGIGGTDADGNFDPVKSFKGEDLVDALGQATTVLALETEE